MKRVVWLLSGLVGAGAVFGAVSPALMDYLAGLDSLRQGQYSEAIASIGKAIGQQQDSSFFLARGVAETLGGNAQEAMNDLERARQDRALGREPELWIYVAETLYGFATPEHRLGGPRAPATTAVSMPGNMMQGRDDYPTDYASFVYQEMAAPVAMARQRGGGGPTPQQLASLKQQAGAWFANRAATRKDLAEAHLARARSLHDSGKYADVITTAQFIKPLYPDDPQTLYLAGDSWAALGRQATARKQLTLALTNAPAYQDPYIARAFTAARLGDERRAREDLDVIAKLNPGFANKYRAALEKEIAAGTVNRNPQQVYAQLEQEARGGTLMEPLVQRAIEFERAFANGRKHYDEWYQDQWRQLDAAAAAAPKDPSPLAKAARFLFEESNLARRSEEVEPRHGRVPFRTQTSEALELRKAIALCDAALKLNQNHVASLMTKAMALERLGQMQQAEQIVNYTLQVAPNDPEALSMRAQFLIGHANSMFSRAQALRSPTVTSSSHEETRSDGVYEVTETTYHPPTQQALAEAGQLEAQAQDYLNRSSAAIQAAFNVTRGTLQGRLLQAQWDIGGGRADAARNELIEALKQAPQSLEANWLLADLYSRTNQTDAMEQQLTTTMNLVETSCGWMLHQAWRYISAGNAQAGAKALDTARQINPSDGRVAAYSAVLANMNGNKQETQAQLRVALAVEEAKYRLDATNPAGVSLPRDMQQLALNLRLRDLLGAPLIASNPTAAITALEPGAVWVVRTPRSGRTAEMFGAMLPVPNAPAIPVPAPENAGALLGQLALDYGKALKAGGRTNDAMAEFQLVIGLGWRAGVGGIGNSRGETNFADVAPQRIVDDARLQAAKIRLEQRDCRGAIDVLHWGVIDGPINDQNKDTPDVVKERDAVFNQARNCAGQGSPVQQSRYPYQQQQPTFQYPRPGPPPR